ncbi:hypothetical protein TNCV_3977451 [Trichonephila clavipes]|nr:hypothetical protein TNCV_3977451 [Trichonephila clavipes]
MAKYTVRRRYRRRNARPNYRRCTGGSRYIDTENIVIEGPVRTSYDYGWTFKVTDVCHIGHDIVEQMGSGGSPQYIAPGVNAFLVLYL